MTHNTGLCAYKCVLIWGKTNNKPFLFTVKYIDVCMFCLSLIRDCSEIFTVEGCYFKGKGELANL